MSGMRRLLECDGKKASQESGGSVQLSLPSHGHRARRSLAVAKSYYSTIFAQPADAVWGVIRDFNHYPVWVDGAGESEIENGKSGDTVGAVRCVLYGGRRIRQQLLSLSDIDRSMTYCFAGESPPPVQDLQVTLRITPVVDGGRAFVEWFATFDCDADVRDERVSFYHEAFVGWLESLRRHLNRQVAEGLLF
jgi:hypothetical protein